MKGRRFYVLGLVVVALLLLPYSGLTDYRQSQHRPYDELQESTPSAFFDSDGDLLRDSEEPFYGTDPADVDTDDDWCPDGVEVAKWNELAEGADAFQRNRMFPLSDADGDGTPNIRDPDSDGDGLLDGWEFENGLDPSSGHTFPEMLPDRWQYYLYWYGDPRDTDVDGMPDDWELAFDLDDPEGDPDADGVSNVGEFLNGTDPLGPDILYGGVLTQEDRDGDGVPTRVERAIGLVEDLRDSDGDNITDGAEMYEHGTDPNSRDTDGDGIPDSNELELGTSPIMKDTDGDGLEDAMEGDTDPTVPDTDKDLIPDKDEIQGVRDTDKDGLPDLVEIASSYGNGGTDPYDPDSDGDGLLDGQEDANRNGRRDGNDPTDRDSDWRAGGETDPTMSDTDGGSMMDRTEIWLGRDPLNPADDHIEVDPPDMPDTPRINPPPRGDPIDLTGLGILLLIIIIVVFIVILMGIMYNTAAAKDDFLEDVIEALEAGEKVLYSITLTDDIRETIFRAYRKFLSVMKAYGHTREEPTTAREFGSQIRQAIDVDDDALFEFTSMFEVARYSDHELGMGDRDRALAAFGAVRESVSRNLGPPDAPVEGEEEEATGGGLLRRLFRARGRT